MLYNNAPSRSSFDIVFIDDLLILLVDLNIGKSVTNDAYNVVKLLDKDIPGGIKNRRVYYRDTGNRYDQILTYHGIFVGFAPCTSSQQVFFQKLASE